MAQNTKQIKVAMPPQLYAALWQEAKDSGTTMAAIVRLAVNQRYELLKLATELLELETQKQIGGSK